MAVDHAADGIRVNCIAPGPVYAPRVSAGGMSEEPQERRRLPPLLTIEGTGWGVGYAALLLVSAQARCITGVVLPVGRSSFDGLRTNEVWRHVAR